MGQRCGAGDYFDDLVHNLVKVNLNSLSTSWFIMDLLHSGVFV